MEGKRSWLRLALTGASLALLALAFAGPAFASGPYLRDLASPTHPDPDTWYADADPVFTWALAVGSVGACDTQDVALDVAVSGEYAYVADFSDGLQVIDVGDPGAPEIVAGCETPGSARGVVVTGGYAFVADGTSGLQVIDVGDPAVPLIVASCALNGYADDVAVAGGYAFVAEGRAGLQVIDVRDPQAPLPVGWVETYGSADGVAVADGYAYVADVYGGLVVIDISDPGAPVIAGSGYVDNATGVAVTGSRAYVADLDRGLVVLDVGDPTAPVVEGSCDLSGQAYDVAVADGRAYVATGYGGLQVVDVADPAAPFVAAVYETPDSAHGVTLDGAFAYVADGTAGLQIVCRDGATDVAYSFALDQMPGTVPDTVADGRESRTRCDGVADGTWFFHVRAVRVDADGRPAGDWGPAAHCRVNIDATGPGTTALSSKTAKGGAVALGYAVTDDRWGIAYVTIDITRGRHKQVRTIDVGWVRSNAVCQTVLDARLPRGCYWFVVHAVDPVGNQESVAGTSSIVVR
jgi:hypothetical protein